MLPKIALVRRGRPDNQGRKLIFLRFAYKGTTSWLSLKISLHEKNWDEKKQQVKAKNDFDLAKISQIINQKLTAAQSFCVDKIVQGDDLTFEDLKGFLAGKKRESVKDKHPIEQMKEVLQTLTGAKIIEKSTLNSYKCAINKFIKTGLCKFIEDLTPEIVMEFRKIVSESNGANLANQYQRNLSVSYRHCLKPLNIKMADPFQGIEIDIKRVSSKKTLSEDQYQTLVNYYDKTESVKEKEIIRRFMVLCKGVRFSDTNLLRKDDLQEFEYKGVKLKYFSHSAQKTEVEGLTPFFKHEEHLLVFNEDGSLFKNTEIHNYNRHLKALSLKVIGIEITSHYGRHYAGDKFINSENMGVDDVQVLLGISDTNIARVYAQRKKNTTLIKLIENNEKNKTNHLNQ